MCETGDVFSLLACKVCKRDACLGQIVAEMENQEGGGGFKVNGEWIPEHSRKEGEASGLRSPGGPGGGDGVSERRSA